MSKATDVQCGIVNNRIYREPLDKEYVMQTYDELMQHLEMDGSCNTKIGRVYGGLITSVVSDPDPTRNGPYYISYTTDYDTFGSPQISYIATKMNIDKGGLVSFTWEELH